MRLMGQMRLIWRAAAALPARELLLTNHFSPLTSHPSTRLMLAQAGMRGSAEHEIRQFRQWNPIFQHFVVFLQNVQRPG
jgi:hypothetical protein